MRERTKTPEPGRMPTASNTGRKLIPPCLNLSAIKKQNTECFPYLSTKQIK